MVLPRRIKRTETVQIPKAQFGGLLGALAFSWSLVIYLYVSQPSSSGVAEGSGIRGLLQQPGGGILTDGAPPVYGILEKIEVNPGGGKPPRKTELTYALPTSTTGDSASGDDIKAVALLLHGCYHHSRDFFTKSSTCERCVGLSEEMRIARILLEQKSIAILAITAHERVQGCWTDADYGHVQDAIDWFFREKLQQSPPTADNNTEKRTRPVLGLGTSSGGVFAAQLAVRGMVDAALVGAMHLRDELTHKWALMKDEGKKPPPIYIAVMPRDSQKMEKIDAEYEIMKDRGPIVVDKETCRSRPVDASYLNERVPKLSITSAHAIVMDLIDAGHIDPVSGMLIKDPTGEPSESSNWREILKSNCGSSGATAAGSCLENQNLELGQSPLAKALNRAWAFHEYCSEVTIKALKYFEQELGGTPFLHT